MNARCRWLNDPAMGRWHLPECMGAAVYGPYGCTCPKRSRDEVSDRIDHLAEEVAALSASVRRLTNTPTSRVASSPQTADPEPGMNKNLSGDQP